VPKPAPETFTRMMRAHDVDPAQTCFFEDSARNLAPAADVGMTTVLVGPHAPASTAPFVDYKTDQLAPFLRDAQVREAA
jgi:putative hydrolase of the HAD superfamily